MADRGLTEAATDRLQAVLAAYGADAARWPEADRGLASLLMTADAALSAPLEDARSLDAVLAQASHPAAPVAAAERLIASIADVPGKVVTFAPREQELMQARRAALPRRLAVPMALAASLALGLYLGASGRSDWLTAPLLAEEPQEYLTAELDVLDGTVQLFEDQVEP